ncbi:hypothetical protein BYT27DRAFT_7336660 [Phlegmacium glaucopus]|nr:hypothetical protein BYT27DRAFT_7336660 [Phlegmacium glaucopus]
MDVSSSDLTDVELDCGDNDDISQGKDQKSEKLLSSSSDHSAADPDIVEEVVLKNNPSTSVETLQKRPRTFSALDEDEVDHSSKKARIEFAPTTAAIPGGAQIRFSRRMAAMRRNPIWSAAPPPTSSSFSRPASNPSPGATVGLTPDMPVDLASARDITLLRRRLALSQGQLLSVKAMDSMSPLKPVDDGKEKEKEITNSLTGSPTGPSDFASSASTTLITKPDSSASILKAARAAHSIVNKTFESTPQTSLSNSYSASIQTSQSI